MTWSALVLAGRRHGACPITEATGVSHKALVPVAGQAMVERVVLALRAVPAVGRIAVMIEEPALLDGMRALQGDDVSILTAAGSPSLSTLAGIDALGMSRSILMTTADTPLVTPKIIGHFVQNQPVGADATVGLARLDTIHATYPNNKRTGLRFSDGPRSGCNLFAFHTQRAREVLRFWRQVEENRKRPLAMLRQVGLVPALRYATRTLPLDAALVALGERTGARLAAIDMPFADAAIDVDKTADLELVERVLAGREA